MTTTTPTPAPAPMTLPERLRAIRFSSNPDDYDAITIEAAAEIDALTARVTELKRERESWLEACEAGYASKIARAEARAQAAEAKLESARRDALEEAALELDRHPDANGSRYIRALQDTRHD